MKKSKILKRLFSDDVIIIPAVDGNKVIFNSEEIFKSWIDSDFENWGLNKPAQKTPEIKAQVYEMVEDANFKEMFSAVNNDLDKLCLTQYQIAEFCAKNQKHLRKDGWATFFLFKVDDKYYVALVFVHSDGLDVDVGRFELDYVWHSEFRPRLVVPQLEN